MERERFQTSVERSSWSLAARNAGEYFANLNTIGGTPEIRQTEVADGVRVNDALAQRPRWGGDY